MIVSEEKQRMEEKYGVEYEMCVCGGGGVEF